MNIEELIDSICNAEYQYTSKSIGETRRARIVSLYSDSAPQERGAIAEAVYRWFASNQDYQEAMKRKQEIAELKASTYIYEKIIANSNFRPLINGNNEDVVVINKGMSNGDVIMAMFPNVNVYEHNGGATYSVNNEYNFNATWWNAPYQKGSKE